MVAFRGWCDECHEELAVNTIKVYELEVFCQNARCPEFALSIWVER